MTRFIDQLAQHPSIASMVAHQRRVAAEPARFGVPSAPLPDQLVQAVRDRGIEQLYAHQAEALDRLRDGDDVLLVTPTSSGKTLMFALAILESLLAEPRSRALVLYPTKALARDQLGGFRRLAAGLGGLRPPAFEIYDGDTPQARRRKIRSEPPEVLITNPDMLHLGILAHHREWEGFLRDLRWIVLDEMHVYRGIFGANVHHILARLQRICGGLGTRPRYVAASATIGNPAEFARSLIGRELTVVDQTGAPNGARDVLFLNPVGVSPYTAAVRVLVEAIRAGKKCIAFTKARRVTELLYTWLVRQDPTLATRVAPYRAGYLPEERRELESRLFRGDLSAVLSTSALELGIDVGALDLCVLVGYPGSLISSWQRIGRVGRQGREGSVVMIAMPDALDQYVVRHPDLFFGRRFEKAVLDPWNPLVAGRHLVCAAAEEPLTGEELARKEGGGRQLVDGLADEGRLVRDAEGQRWFSFRRRPHRDVSTRSAGQPFHIVDRSTGKPMGSIDGQRVYHECHPGAVYLHGGRTYVIRELDVERRRVTAEPAGVDYYTVVLGEKETEILERLSEDRVGEHPIGLGRLKVTVQIREYQKKRLFDGEPISNHPLEVPPLIFETIGFWVELPVEWPARFSAHDLHFMGGIHATEHATIGLFPLLAISDRDDIGGISYTGHPQIGGPAIFVYDGVPGGAGLAERGFAELTAMLQRTLDLIAHCECENGCPACIQSPKCGNGNKPLDKQAAIHVLELLLGHRELEELLPPRVEEPAPAIAQPTIAPGGALDAERKPSFFGPEGSTPRPFRRHGVTRAGNLEPKQARERKRLSRIEAAGEPRDESARAATQTTGSDGRVLVFDLETQRSAEEVGGWGNIAKMGLALAVVWDSREGEYRTYHEEDVHRLLLDLVMADCVVGFNVDRFDLEVLSAYGDWDLSRIRTLDLLVDIHRRLGFRLSLAHLAQANLGQSKSADGLQSIVWWKEGRIDLIERYCRKDVELTRKIWELGRDQGYLLYRDHSERSVRVPVAW